MMRWGRKKPSPSSSPAVCRVFPVSWFARLKHVRAGSEKISDELKPTEFLSSDIPSSPWPSSSRDRRFHCGEAGVDSDEAIPVPVSSEKFSDMVLDLRMNRRKVEERTRGTERKRHGRKKGKEKKEKQRRTAFDEFAIVKTSLDPQQDFRDSMIEMITEKKLRRPEELEELLACYLIMNSDEYHELIIKVFRQVWFDLDGASFVL